MKADPRFPARFYRCNLAARWLPRVLAAAILIGALVAGYRLADTAMGARFRFVLVGSAALIALFVVRAGAEVRLAIRPQAEGLAFRLGRARSLLRYDRIDSLRFEGPFASGLRWIPTVVLISNRGDSWRIPALIADGEGLIDDLIRLSGREDLASWVDALGLKQRFRRVRSTLLAGYGAAAAIAAAGIVFYLRR